MSETYEVAGHGGGVHVRLWLADAPARALVMIVHGYAEHGGRYAHVAAELTARRVAVVAPDHVGHGRSDGERALITDFERVVDDLGIVATSALDRVGPVPLVLVGHSMGGLLSARFVQRWPDRIEGVAFLGAVIGDWRWAREVLALPELPASDSDPSGMSRDPETCAAYDADPLVYRGTYKRQLLEAEVAALDAFQVDLERITVPVAFFHGTADPFVPYGDSLRAVIDMPSHDKWIKLYDGARHELVNEINRAEVIADLLHWVEGVVS